MTAAEPLTGPRAAPRSGQTRSLVILLHGYGADGKDLIGLAEPLSELMPDTAFVAPDAPQRSLVNPMGRQWFPIPRIDGSTAEAMQEGYLAAAAALDAYIAGVVAAEGVERSHTALIGFSQGTMMALAVGPRRAPALAGIVGLSGRLIDPDGLGLAEARPPVLLVHGDRDEVVPYASMAEAAQGLADAGFEVSTFTSRGVGHGIAPDGLGLAAGFLMDKLGIPRPG